ncbi:hypothetical protein ACTMQE_13950 [Escherichia coli]
MAAATKKKWREGEILEAQAGREKLFTSQRERPETTNGMFRLNYLIKLKKKKKKKNGRKSWQAGSDQIIMLRMYFATEMRLARGWQPGWPGWQQSTRGYQAPGYQAARLAPN